jgi:Heterokaryon incompatibility protein (HET)
MSISPKAFPYEALTEKDGIRLIIIPPKASGNRTVTTVNPDAFQCSLIHTTLSQCENEIIDHYTALSYAWGDATDTRTIWVNESPIQVTANLYAALNDLQDEIRVLRLWADALCINQQDDEEKNRQVMMMGRIYTLAHHTVIYLGPLTVASEALLKALASRTGTEEEVIIGDLDRSTIDSGRLDLLRRPWFNRVWVLQELVLARDPWVQCGKLRLRWNRIYDFLYPTAQPQGSSMSREDMTLLGMQKFRNLYHASLFSETPKPDLLDLVASRRGLGVSDGRDMIFAHLGLVSDLPDHRIAVDYKKSCVRVYEDFALYVMEKLGVNYITRHVEDIPPEQRMQGLPSWVPDWTWLPQHKQQYRFDQYKDDESSRNPRQEYFPIQESSILVVIGNEPDPIVDISVELSSSLFSAAQRRQFQDGFRSIRNVHDLHGQLGVRNLRDSPLPQIWDAWCAVLGNDVISSTRMIDANVYLQFLLEDPSIILPYLDIFLGSHLLTLFDPRISSANPIEGRRLAKLASGLCSIVPASTCKEDIYVATKGLIASWILRPLNSPKRDQHLEAQIRGRNPYDRFKMGIMPIKHCVLVGQCWTYSKSPYTNSRSHTSQETLYAIH